MTQTKLTLAMHQRRIEGLDGIRALAVAAVIIFHADLGHFLPGGFLGVDVFFVLSGYLITSLLFQELENTSTISFAGFYVRRIKRLLPALLTVLFACSAYSACFAHDAIQALRNDIPPALLYFSNLWQLIDAQPYFEQFGRPHALQHLWSLAIEEQFYILWPLLVFFFRFRKNLTLTILIGLLGLCSIAWMAWLAELNNIPYENKPERLYFGTDTHAIGLLLGAFLASCYRPKVTSPSAAPWHWNLLGSAALIYLIACFLLLDESSGFLYRGGFASVSLATVLLILGASHHGSVANILFQHPLGDWIGKRSYSLYLWHWPVFVYFRPGEELPDNMAVSCLIRLCLTVALSDATYRFIELPIRTHGLQAFGKFSRITFASTCIACMAAFGALHLYEAPQAITGEVQATMGELQTATEQIRAEVPEEVAATPDAPAAPLSVNPQEFIRKEGVSDAYSLNLTDIRITALGDSVMLGARPVLTQKLPITYLDAEVGRQGSDLLKRVKQLSESKELSETVLIHIGTNGYIYEQNLKQILHILQDRKHVVFINVHADRRWTDDNNTLLKKYQKNYDNISLVDWHAASESHPEYFVKDGIHLTGKGMTAYAEFARVALGVPDMPNRTTLTVARHTSAKNAPSRQVESDAMTTNSDAPPAHTEEVTPSVEEGEAHRNGSA